MTSIVCAVAVYSAFAQQIEVNPCGTYERMDELGKLPEYQNNLLQSALIEAEETELVAPKGIVYTVPIVFHVLHDGGESNISYEQIVDGLRILNEDYRMLNPDVNDVAPVFAGMQADAEIQFVLATKAPNGECFRGVTRTYNPTASNDGNQDQVAAIRNGNDVYNGDWPGDQYLNVFVVGSLSDPGSSLVTLGYTTYPAFGGTSMSNGFHVIHQCIGSIGTGGAYGLATPTHEIGHWLNLPHVWGSNNNPGNASSCNTDDGIQDTPACIGIQGGPCSPTNPNPLNSCDSDDAYWGFDIQDNTENYMDYAHCDRMFTQGQVDEMRSALLSSVGGRNNLWTASNLMETGADGNIYLCDAEFEADKRTVCAGESIQFTDFSFNVVNGWSWDFAGGTPANSTDQNPTVTYNTPGIYEVTLSATDGSITDVETKTAFIRVLPASAQLPFLETFENYSTLSNIEEWEIINEEGNGFELEGSVGHTGTKCAKLSNNGEAVGRFDELIAGVPVDLSNVSQVTMSFRYAYRRKNTSDDDWLRVLVSNDCGDSWALRKTLHGFTLSDQTQFAQYTPSTQEEWITVHMTNITSAYWINNFRYKFAFESGGGNNFFIDDINIYDSAPSDDLVVGLDEMSELQGVSLFPNPSDSELSVQFKLSGAQSTTIEVQNTGGQAIQKHTVFANEGSNLVVLNVEDLAAGLYFLRLTSQNAHKTIQFVVK